MKKLPKLYKNETNNSKDNNKKVCYLKENNIKNEIDEIFNGLGHPYNTKIFIKTKNKSYETYPVSRTNKYITTLDNDTILIDDIIYLKRLNK